MTAPEPRADVREMYMAHTMMRREFTLLPELVRGAAVGDRQRAEVLVRHIELIEGVLSHHHHSEDTHLWPRLLERGAAEIAPVVHLMEQQHRTIDELTVELRAATAAWRDTATREAAEAVAAVLDRMCPALDEHLRVEEEQVLPLIEKHVTASEWDRMVAEGAGDTPVELLPLMFGLMTYEGDPEVVQKAISQMPEEARPVIAGVAAQAFAAHSQIIHGTPTPPRVGAA
ncbi:hemerythrin domain-containing protein [Micromonospora sp. CPCC 205556]|uniref:hemerythrin domain-containing protein n=1 Tax=Micromonospora sp. CPCC 205556 TaxID=3122398 RepID=UPI002FF0D702